MTMNAAVVVALISLTITTLSGFAVVLMKLGAMQMQLALLWTWYLAECGPGVPGGRRRTDPPAVFGSVTRAADDGAVS